MRTILSIISIFAFFSLSAQNQIATSSGKEPSRQSLMPHNSEQMADNTLELQLAQWQADGNTFTHSFPVTFDWENRTQIFRLASASSPYRVYVNSREIAQNANNSTPAEFNISRYTKQGVNSVKIELLTDDTIAAALESWRPKTEIATIGKASIIAPPTMYIRDILTNTTLTEPTSEVANGEVAIIVKTQSLNPRQSRVHYTLLSPSGKSVVKGYQDMRLTMRGEDTLRFVVPIELDSLWSASSPTRYTLRLSTQYKGRHLEHLERKVGFASVDFVDGKMVINGTEEPLKSTNLRQDTSIEEFQELKAQGYNTFITPLGAATEPLIELIDSIGGYVIVQAPIDSSRSGMSRTIMGNPSNNPAYQNAFIERATDSYHTTKSHPSVVGFTIATKSANGINLYESYLSLKALESRRAVLYFDAEGEWNSDKVHFE